MKKVFLFLTCAILLGTSCSQQSTELTDEQKATMISQAEEQYVEGVSNLSKLDMEIWTQPWSMDHFISAFSGVNYYSTFNEFKDSVTYYFSLRESQEVKIDDMHATLLADDLVLISSITSWDVLFKTGDRVVLDNVLTTLLFKKEESGWKIIYLHESWQED